MALTDNLVAFWELNEASGNAIDSLGSNDLTDNNTVGASGIARDFEDTNSEFFSHVSNATLQMGDIDFTILAWVRPETATGTHQIVAKDDDAGSARDYTLDISGGDFRFYINGGGSGIAQLGTVSAATDYMVVGQHDATGDTVGISVNASAFTTTGTGGISPNVSAAEFRVGAREYAGFENYWDGLIWRVGLWKRKLSGAEVTSLYNGGSGLSYAAMGGGSSSAKPAHYYRQLRQQ